MIVSKPQCVWTLAFIAALFTLLTSGPASAEPLAYPIDEGHSILEFEVWFGGLTRVRGTFDRYDGTIVWDENDPTRSRVTVTIDISSIDTGRPPRDEHLQQADFFDVENFPQARFQSVRIEQSNDGFRVMGPFTLRGITKNVTIPARIVSPPSDDPWGNRRVTFEGSFTINRKEFGIEGPKFWNEAISDDVKIEIVASARISRYDRWSFPPGDKPSIGPVLLDLLETVDGQAAVQQYEKLKREKPDEYDFSGNAVVVVALKTLQAGRAADALSLLEMLDEPDSEGQLVQLERTKGQALHALGDHERALASFRKILEMRPWSSYEIEMIRGLEETSSKGDQP